MACPGLVLVASLFASAPSQRGGATVWGRVTTDGQAVQEISIKLVRLEIGRETRLLETKTDQEGRYVFRSLEKGEYTLLIRVVVDGRVRCDTSSPGFTVNLLQGKDPLGQMVTLVTARSAKTPLRVTPGRGALQDLALSCAPTEGKD